MGYQASAGISTHWPRAIAIVAITLLFAVACGKGSSPTAPTPAPDPAPPPQAAAPAVTVSGIVSNKELAAPIAAVRVDVLTGETTTQSAVSDTDGHYELRNLPVGAYTFRAAAEGFDTFTSSIELTADRAIDVALVPSAGGGPAPAPLWTLSGTVVDASSQDAIPGVRVELVDGVNSGRHTSTDSAGRYQFSRLEPGDTIVRALRDEYAPASASVTLERNLTQDFTLSRVVAPGAPGPDVSGLVVDVLTGQPLSDVTVRIDGGSETKTDSSGAFTTVGAASGGAQRVMLASVATVERHTRVRVPGTLPTLGLIPRTIDLHTFDQMFRARGGLHRWVEAPRLVVQRRVLAFSGTSAMTYTATVEKMSESDAADLVADLLWALPQLTGQTFTHFAAVDIELADEGAEVAITRPGTIMVARYDGLDDAISAWGYGRWAWNGAGEVEMGAMMLDNTFEQSDSPYRRSLRAHELGHTLGYDHVSAASAMNISGRIEPTPFDHDATKIAFQRAPLNMSPDIDPDPITVNRQTTLRSILRWEGAR